MLPSARPLSWILQPVDPRASPGGLGKPGRSECGGKLLSLSCPSHRGEVMQPRELSCFHDNESHQSWFQCNVSAGFSLLQDLSCGSWLAHKAPGRRHCVKTHWEGKRKVFFQCISLWGGVCACVCECFHCWLHVQKQIAWSLCDTDGIPVFAGACQVPYSLS